ncbi:GNAT family N-acetyltransferase [Bacillus suaedaesalsae]|uniref:GNAT family N-acetyltransferase n=1 Tax=Bacillus suaedaesalsae TaxID=2810349 RepID=A0ABS2DGJ0_9BACI|nr:GNAT family N-acetyltransferase [Bacillus suaedaesalsae]
MQHLTINEVTVHNFIPVINLKLAESQKNHIASNVYSIAESKVNPCFTPYAIYLGEEVIGFVMTDYDQTLEDKNKYWIPRLMIDERYQGKGYGKLAMNIIIENLFSNDDCSCIRLSTEPSNVSAIKFYESIGFVQTGELLEELEVILQLNKEKWFSSARL